jgi:hypothetical protein
MPPSTSRGRYNWARPAAAVRAGVVGAGVCVKVPGPTVDGDVTMNWERVVVGVGGVKTAVKSFPKYISTL